MFLLRLPEVLKWEFILNALSINPLVSPFSFFPIELFYFSLTTLQMHHFIYQIVDTILHNKFSIQ